MGLGFCNHKKGAKVLFCIWIEYSLGEKGQVSWYSDVYMGFFQDRRLSDKTHLTVLRCPVSPL